MKDFKPAFMPDGKIIETERDFEQVFKDCGFDAPDFCPPLPCLICICSEGFCMMDKDEIDKLHSLITPTKEN